MQVIGEYENGTIANSYVLARDAAGTIFRRTDVVLERWEILTDAEDLRICRKHFDDRDRLAAEIDFKANALTHLDSPSL